MANSERMYGEMSTRNVVKIFLQGGTPDEIFFGLLDVEAKMSPHNLSEEGVRLIVDDKKVRNTAWLYRYFMNVHMLRQDQGWECPDEGLYFIPLHPFSEYPVAVYKVSSAKEIYEALCDLERLDIKRKREEAKKTSVPMKKR